MWVWSYNQPYLNNIYYLNIIIIILSFVTDTLRILVILPTFFLSIHKKNDIIFYNIMWRNHVASNLLESDLGFKNNTMISPSNFFGMSRLGYNYIHLVIVYSKTR